MKEIGTKCSLVSNLHRRKIFTSLCNFFFINYNFGAPLFVNGDQNNESPPTTGIDRAINRGIFGLSGSFLVGNRAFLLILSFVTSVLVYRYEYTLRNDLGFDPHSKMVDIVAVAKELNVYKVIDAAAVSVRSYNADFISRRTVTEVAPYPEEALFYVDDWRGLYTQFKVAHTLGTIPYRWERDDVTMAALIKVTIHSPFNIAVLDGAMWHDGNISGKQKADLAKQLLSLPHNEPLVTSLGQSNTAVMVWETPEEPELIFSHELLASLEFSEQYVALFQRHERRPVTCRWRHHPNQPWKTWNDNEQKYEPGILDLSYDCILDGRNS